MENSVVKFEIVNISNIESIKSTVLSKGQLEVVQSVINNGQLVPVHIDSVNKLIDGVLRVRANIDAGISTIDAIIVDKFESTSADATSKYIINNHRHNMSVAKRAKLALEATDDLDNADLVNDKCMKLGIKTSDDDLDKSNINSKLSKSHLTKYKSINGLPQDIKDKINEYEIPMNASYELGKGYKIDDLNAADLKVIVEEIKDMSDRKAVSHIKTQIKRRINTKINDGVVLTDEKIDAVKFRKTTISIDVTKHFEDDKYSIDDLAEEEIIAIKE